MYKAPNGKTYYKIGLHLHTTNSDGKKTPGEAAQIYKNAGYDAIALTDHWYYTEECELCGIKVIPGIEYNTGTNTSEVGVMHILGLGMQKDPHIPRDASNAVIIDGIKKAGGIAVLAHPAWSLNTYEDVKELPDFCATEIYNAVSDAHESFRPYSGYFADILANKGMYLMLLATDDVHYYDGSDETNAYIMAECGSLETADILSCIKQGRFYATQGPELYTEMSDGKITVSCSECTRIAFISNATWASGRCFRGERLTSAEYVIKDFDKWIRVEVTDKNGKCAWSNIMVPNK